MANQPRAPIITRLWSSDPAGVAVRAQGNVYSNPINLRGQDKFFGAGGPNYDYPNPRAPARASDLRTWVWPLNPNLKDTFYGLGGPSYDYPNPRGYQFPIDLRTWTWRWPGLLPQPFMGLGGHPNFDWPNPRGYQYPISNRGWIKQTQPLLYGIIAIQTNYDRPNPRGYQFPIDLRGWIWQGNIQLGRVVGRPSLCYSSESAVINCTASDSPSGQNWSGAGYMAKYEIETSIEIEGVFRDSLTGIYVDPTEVQLFVKDPAGAIVDHTTLDGSITRSETGHYLFDFVVDQAGTWTYKWLGTGAYVASSPDTTFTVNSTVLF